MVDLTKSKILIINNGLAGGGIERASISLANHWAKEGLSIYLLALYQSQPFFSLHDSIQFSEPSFEYGGNRIVYNLKLLKYIRQSIKRIKPDVILAFGESTNPYVLLAAQGLNVPVFVSDRMHPKARLPKFIFILKKWLYPKATGIIAQTQLARRVMQSYLGGVNIHVIPNPVNVINRLDLPRKKIIVSVGRLEEVKGHRYLIEAFAKLEQKDWILSLIGDGSLRQELIDLATSLGVQDRVLFHGYKKNFRKDLSEASIFVLPSLKEGFPNALLEAMSVPLPCIATDFIGQPNEIINDRKNGLLVPVKDVKKLVAAMGRLADCPQLREELASEAFGVREEFSFDKIANRYLTTILGEC